MFANLQAGKGVEDYLHGVATQNLELKRTQPYILQIGRIEDAGFYIVVDGSVLTVKPVKISTALVDLLCFFSASMLNIRRS